MRSLKHVALYLTIGLSIAVGGVLFRPFIITLAFKLLGIPLVESNL